MATVVLNFTTTNRSFPVGTVAGDFIATLTRVDGLVLSKTQASAPLTFSDVQAGSYIARVSRNGVDSGSYACNVPNPPPPPPPAPPADVQIAVPGPIVVTINV